MRSTIAIIALSGLALAAGADNEPVAEAPITSVALFKNGVVAVVRTVAARGAAPYLIAEKIEPAHGTLWFTPGEDLGVRTVSRAFDAPLLNPFANLTQAYEGRKVTLTMRAGAGGIVFRTAAAGAPAAGGNAAAIGAPLTYAGTVVNPAAEAVAKAWSRDYGTEERNWRHYYASSLRSPAVGGGGELNSGYLTLQLESGERLAVPTAAIESLRAEGVNHACKEEREVWLVEPGPKTAGKPLEISYLAKGISWAPSYRIALSGPTKLTIAMSAVIRNELGAFKNAETSLISGYPNIEFANRASLLTPGMTLAAFFQGLGRAQQSGAQVMSQMVMFNSAPPQARDSYTLPDVNEGRGSADMHYRNIGRLSLAEGESLYLPLERAESACERIVCWDIADRRNVWGRIEGNDASVSQGDLWDSLRFKNPFGAPMTTAPTEITEAERVLGQSTTYWTNPGQECTVRITRALSVSGSYVENEVDMKRPYELLAGRRFRKPDVEGLLAIRNHRGTPAKIVARMEFSGELLAADGEPRKRLLESGVYCVNPRNELVWEIPLAAGERTELKLRYSVLVEH